MNATVSTVPPEPLDAHGCCAPFPWDRPYDPMQRPALGSWSFLAHMPEAISACSLLHLHPWWPLPYGGTCLPGVLYGTWVKPGLYMNHILGLASVSSLLCVPHFSFLDQSRILILAQASWEPRMEWFSTWLWKLQFPRASTRAHMSQERCKAEGKGPGKSL